MKKKGQKCGNGKGIYFSFVFVVVVVAERDILILPSCENQQQFNSFKHHQPPSPSQRIDPILMLNTRIRPVCDGIVYVTRTMCDVRRRVPTYVNGFQNKIYFNY